MRDMGVILEDFGVLEYAEGWEQMRGLVVEKGRE